ncbi:hypothetical protein NCS57_00514700 [Fusarium keratoplasticum]|uniref:Uncharacterized protein n=1 Tax=Fusarium keratoplasticum TaxID=1328300 RepID=A0ACC0R0B3_9HYPO|nr:hypothetical protein NCS57_00514700 [Fusarium keratoplasticum]KAI8670435.1 hypothetical protein NCS57_00514700 [Fusarium keratoplasticum]
MPIQQRADSPDLPPPTRFVEYGLRPKLEASRTAMRVYLSLLASQRSGDQGLELRIRQQSEIVLENLRPLRKEVVNIGRDARAKRGRTWGVGACIASLAPWIAPWVANAISPEGAVPWRTEHTFNRNPHLLMHNLALLRSRCKSTITFALVALAVLFISRNELVIHASRSISTRLQSLCAGVESRDPSAADVDDEALEGWDWKIL